MPIHSVAITLHVLGAVVWVGGMFLLYVCLRPALPTLEPPQRLKLLRGTLARFFPCVWVAILLILGSGYWMIFGIYGGFKGLPLYIHWMQLLGLVMVGLFVWLFHGPWLAFKRAVDAQDWPVAAKRHDRIRQIVAVNLPLGLLVIVIGAGGRFWG
jgi:uncharacterized membrane protein